MAVVRRVAQQVLVTLRFLIRWGSSTEGWEVLSWMNAIQRTCGSKVSHLHPFHCINQAASVPLRPEARERAAQGARQDSGEGHRLWQQLLRGQAVSELLYCLPHIFINSLCTCAGQPAGGSINCTMALLDTPFAATAFLAACTPTSSRASTAHQRSVGGGQVVCSGWYRQM